MTTVSPPLSHPDMRADISTMHRPLGLPLDRTALLVIDMQEEHRQDERFLASGFDAVVANVARLQSAARAAKLPLFHCAYVIDAANLPRRFHPVLEDGTSAFSDSADPRTAICPEVAPRAGERLLVKTEASAFGATSPEAELRDRAIEWLVVCGAWTEACVDASVRDAVSKGFRVLLVKDACASGTEAMHQTAILNLANRLYGGAVVDTQTACRLLAGETADAWQIRGAVPIRFTYANAAQLYETL